MINPVRTNLPRFVFGISLLTTAILANGQAPPSDSLNSHAARRPNYRSSTAKQNDILHTRLDVSFDWSKSQMKGVATITAKPWFKPTSRLDLNARGMDIQSVEVFDLSTSKNRQKNISVTNPEVLTDKKLNSSFKYENDSIKINLGREFAADENYLVKISYIAKPNEIKKGGSQAISDDKGLFFINPKGEDKTKMPQIWTQGETQASSAWFPTIDSPNEKMTQDIFMTVDAKYTTLSNGLLTDSKKNSDGTRTDHWKMDLPHSPYLVMMGVGEFTKVTDAPWNGKEISYYVEKEYAPYAKDIFGNTKEMIEFYSQVLGTPYPWQKYAQIVARDYVSGAMENTSATLHGDFMVYQTDREMLDGKKGQAVIAHELFHQWFGDLVTAESWSNLSLNESFATYGEYLWEEYKNGRDAADARSYQSRVGYFKAANGKQVNVIRYDYEDKEDMFDAWSYNKGGQILHMLRKYVGDAAFFASLKLYLERNRFENAEIHDLRLAFERVTGEDLNWFFDEWFLAKGHPVIDVQKNYDIPSKTLMLKVIQKQDLQQNPLYKLPVEVDIYSLGRKEKHKITIDKAEQEFTFHCEVNPDLVNFDAEKQLLAIKNFSKSVEELVFQYWNAPLFSDRAEALTVLKNKLDQEAVYKMYVHAAEKDKWYELRLQAIEALKPVSMAKEADLRPVMTTVALSDKNTNVRAQAINFLSSYYKGTELTGLYKKAAGEQSYLVLAAGLNALVKSDPQLALQKAKELENENNQQVFEVVSSVYSRIGSDENNSYFIKSKDYFHGPRQANYLMRYDLFLKKCKEPGTFESAAMVYLEVMKNENQFVRESAKKDYQEYIIGSLIKKEEELVVAKEDSEKIKNLQTLRLKLEKLYKNSSLQ